MNASLSAVTRPHVDASHDLPRPPSVFAIVAALGIAVYASVDAVSAQQVAERNGMLTDNAGKTLYSFDKDASGKSNCNGGCAIAWPPFYAGDAAKDNAPFTIVTRDDGRRQWARDGKPLYFFAGDAKAGDLNGDGSGGVWHVVKPAAVKAESQPAKAAAHTSGSYGYASSDYGYAYKP